MSFHENEVLQRRQQHGDDAVRKKQGWIKKISFFIVIIWLKLASEKNPNPAWTCFFVDSRL